MKNIRKQVLTECRQIIVKAGTRLLTSRESIAELVSGLAGIGRTHLSAIERGIRRPTLETFFRIAEAMEMEPSKLLTEIEQEMRR